MEGGWRCGDSLWRILVESGDVDANAVLMLSFVVEIWCGIVVVETGVIL